MAPILNTSPHFVIIDNIRLAWRYAPAFDQLSILRIVAITQSICDA
jgi:hypothetical protein